MAAGKLTQGACAPDKKLSQGAWEQSKVSAVGASAVPVFRGNLGMMVGMSSGMWFETDWLKPTGGN